MSLPFKYRAREDYVEGTIKEVQNDECSSLQIGEFYLKRSVLEPGHVLAILQHATRSNQLKEIKFCGVTLEEESTGVLSSLLQEGSCKQLRHLSFSACRGCGIQALSRESTITPLEFIRIEATDMTGSDLNALWSYVQYSQSLQNLQLFEANIAVDSNDNGNRLTAALSETASLRFLELSYCIFDDQSISHLVHGLANKQSLHTLSIPAGELDDSQLKRILSNLTNLSKLKVLKLPRNFLQQEGSEALGDLLDQNTSSCHLESLDLSHQHTERATKLDSRMFSQHLTTNSSLTSLNLSFCKLNNVDAIALASSLGHNQALQDLDLRSNNIRDDGIIALADYIGSSPRLKKMFLFGNPFREAGAAALYKAIKVNTIMQILNMGYSSCYYDIIQLYTCLNRAGRGLLSQDLDPAIWPMVFARSEAISRSSRGTCSSADLIFQLLHGPVLMEL